MAGRPGFARAKRNAQPPTPSADPPAFGDPSGVRESSEILLKTYSKTMPIPRSTAKDVVNGWNQGLAEIMAELQTDLRGSLDAAGVPFSSGSFPEATPRRPTRS